MKRINQSIYRHYLKWNNKMAAHADAFGVVEIILILVIIIGLVLLFKDEISQIVKDAINSIKGDVNKIV